MFLISNDIWQTSFCLANVNKEYVTSNSFSIITLIGFADKKYEAFVVEKRSKPNEVVNSTVQFNGINCGDLRKINFYK